MAKKNGPKGNAFDRLRLAQQAGMPKSNWVQAIPGDQRPPEAWHIAVRGNIDIRQHHPDWYLRIGCIDEAEHADGMKSLAMVALPQAPGGIMQFDVGAFAINVIPDRWMIQTVTESNKERLIEIVSAVFDRLRDITITAYGVNKTLILEVRNGSASHFLAEQLSFSQLGLETKQSEASIQFVKHLENHDTQIWFHALPENSRWIVVEHNQHHPVTKTPPTFDLRAAMKIDAMADWSAAAAYEATLANSIASGETNASK
jgi:hypothetical protein